jgi:hypothetical protein
LPKKNSQVTVITPITMPITLKICKEQLFIVYTKKIKADSSKQVRMNQNITVSNILAYFY